MRPRHRIGAASGVQRAIDPPVQSLLRFIPGKGRGDEGGYDMPPAFAGMGRSRSDDTTLRSVAGKDLDPGRRRFLRGALCRPAPIAARCTPKRRQKHQTMIQAGKPAKVALTALLRKLTEMAKLPVRKDRTWTQGTA